MFMISFPPSSVGVPHLHVKTDRASPIGLNLTRPSSANNRTLVILTTILKRLQPDDRAFLKLAIPPATQVSPAMLDDQWK